MNLEELIFANCKNCHLIYENPITLQCKNSLCKQHLDQFDDKFECFFCKIEHLVCEDWFNIN